MKVYVVFSTSGEGDSYTIFDFEAVCSSVDAAQDFVGNVLLANNHRLSGVNDHRVHPSMNFDNNYTYIGKRKDCNECLDYGEFGGYVIEETEIIN